jgi:hypothetical protein
MFYFHPLTCVTKRYILGYVTLHPVPPVGKLETLIHFISSGVNWVCWIMSFSEYEVLNFLNIWYTNTPLVSKYTLIIFSETRGLALSYIPLNLLGICVLHLTLAYILRKHWIYFHSDHSSIDSQPQICLANSSHRSKGTISTINPFK